MRRKSFLGVSGAALIGTAMPIAGAAEVHVINLLPPLFPLIGRGDDAAIATVRRDLLEPNRAVFDAVLRSSIDEVSNERIRSYLLALPPYAEKMRALADSFTKTFDEQRPHSCGRSPISRTTVPFISCPRSQPSTGRRVWSPVNGR